MESLIAAGSVTSICRDGDVTETVVTAVAQAKGVDPLELDPLYDVIDPDALNQLFDSAGTAPPAAMELGFTMAGCRVVVRGDGEVVVEPPTEDDDNPTVIGHREE